MKKFAGNKTFEQIQEQCKAQGLTIDDASHKKGWDHVFISGGGCEVTYNTFNGNFWGTTPDGTEFDSRSTANENEPWFQALLSFFYAEN